MSHLLASLHIVVQVSKLYEGKVTGAEKDDLLFGIRRLYFSGAASLFGHGGPTMYFLQLTRLPGTPGSIQVL